MFQPEFSATSENDPEHLNQITPISNLKNFVLPDDVQTLSQMEPIGNKTLAELSNESTFEEITPSKANPFYISN